MKTDKWTKQQEQLLIDNIKSSPNNLMEAFRITSAQIDKSVNSIVFRWYGQKSKNYIGLKDRCVPVFMTISGKTNNVNRKIVTQDTSDNTIKSNNNIWKKLLSLFKL